MEAASEKADQVATAMDDSSDLNTGDRRTMEDEAIANQAGPETGAKVVTASPQKRLFSAPLETRNYSVDELSSDCRIFAAQNKS